MRYVKLPEISKMGSGGTPSRKKAEFYKNGTIPWLKSGELNNGIVTSAEEYITEEAVKRSSAKLAPKGSLLVAMYGATAGKVGLLDFNSSLNQAICFITPDKKQADVRYLYYFLMSKNQELLDSREGGGQPNISQTILKNLKIPLPSLEEQKAIVAKLDRAQRLIDIDKAMLAKYDQLIQSVFLDMFGDPVTNPKGWEVKELEEVCTKITDGTHHSPETFEKADFPYITAKHVDAFEVDFFSKPSYVTKEAHNQIFSRCNPELGDVLLIKDGATTGKAAINPYDFEFSMLSSLALLKLNQEFILGEYLVNVLNDETFKEDIRQKYMSGAAIKRYTLRKIKAFELPIPSLDLQKDFEKIVVKIITEKELKRLELKKSEALFSSLVQEVFGPSVGG